MAQPKSEKPEEPQLPEPDSDMQAAAARAASRTLRRRPRVQVVLQGNDISPPHTMSDGWVAMLMDAAGTRSDPFAMMLVDQLSAQTRRNGEQSTNERKLNAFLALMDGSEPENEVQALLVAQMAASHDLAMEMARRSKQADKLLAMNDTANLAIKLMRTFALQAEALAKLKRGGEQRVKVEHVHVYPGGQAIVGNVQAGGGAQQQIEDQPHAITDTIESVLRGQDAERDALPMPADGKRPL